MADMSLLISALYAAYTIRFDLSVPREELSTLLSVLPFVIAAHLFFNFLFGVYQRLWRYTTFADLMGIILASLSTISSIFLYDIFINQNNFHLIPYGVIAIYFFLSVTFLFSGRMLRKSLSKTGLKMRAGAGKRVLIVGAGEVGQKVAGELRSSRRPQNPSVFLDDDEKKVGKKILGIPVEGRTKDLVKVVQENGIEEVVMAMPSAPREKIRSMVNQCTQLGLPVKIVPAYQEVIESSTSTLQRIREVEIADLLGREPAKLDIQSMASYLSSASILVTGAGGSIGSELCRQLMGFHPRRLILLGHGENSIYQIEMELRNKKLPVELLPLIADIQNKFKIEQIFDEYRPEIVFHAAAHKHVPLMEANPDEAVLNNVFGTRNMVQAADKFGVKSFVLVSTDKAVNPTNVMGATKRVAEIIVQEMARRSNTKFSAVRFGNVLGSRGSVIPLFKKQIEMGGPITITHPEATRYFMTIPEASQLILQSGAMAQGGEIFILDMGEPVKIVDMAKELIRLSGLDESDIEIQFVGLRPGEKLKEELLTAEEGTTSTKMEKIFIAKPNQFDPSVFVGRLDELNKMAELGRKDEIFSLIKEIVPTYTPLKIE